MNAAYAVFVDAPDTVEHGRIVVGVDDHPGSSAAVEWAAAEAAARGVPLSLVHTWSWGLMSTRTPDLERAVLPGVRQRGEEILNRNAAIARVHGGLRVGTSLVEGYPDKVLEAQADDAALVVVGTHHQNWAGRAVLGSSSSALAAHATCPVVVVNAPQGPPNPEAGVIVGVTGDSHDDRLLEFGFGYARRHHLSLHAIACWNPLLGDRRLPPSHRLEIAVNEMMARWQARFPDVPATTTVLRAAPIPTLSEISTYQALLVVGRRREHARLGSLLGSVSRGILHHAVCPVAVVPPEVPVTTGEEVARPSLVSAPSRPAGVIQPTKESAMSNSVTIEFTEDEVRLLHNALRSFLSDFGHDEADIVAQLRALIAKLPQASPS